MRSIDSSYIVPPFPAFPSTSRYVPLGSVQDALGRVCRSIDARDAVSLVIGPPGTGKSLICGLLVEHYRETHKVVVLGETPLENQAAFLRHLLHHLGANFSTIPDGDLQLALIDEVCGKEAPEGGLLIVVDEAQSLPAEVIESIRMVTNIMHDGEPRVVAVLCGGVKLDETLVEPCMEAFTQRVATRCYLHPMNGEETRRYVAETIRNCGADPDETITDEAIAAVHHACSGVPRLINQMLTQAIDCAGDAEQVLIDAQIVDLAWAHLQQLPSPMVEEPKIAGDGAPIEFGELDESVNFAEWTPHKASESVTEQEQSPAETLQSDEHESDEHGCEMGDCDAGQCKTGNCQTAVSSSETDVEGDIEFRESSAQWVQELDEQASEEPAEVEFAHNATTTSPTALFGHFDDEEELEVGSGIVPAVSSPTPAAPANLEEMLHQELVGVNTVASEDPAAHLMKQDNDAHDFDDEPEERVEDFIIVSDEKPEHQQAVEEKPLLWLADASAVEKCEDMQIRDDSDILVIEDEVELRRVDTAARVDAQDQTISVDFQAMLNRMRTGN